MLENLFICWLIVTAFLVGAVLIGGGCTIAGIGVMRVYDRQAKRRKLCVIRRVS